MSKLMYAEAEYMQPYHIDISHLKINYDDIEHHWCKYGTLYIEMKDGTTHEVDGEHLDADYK